MPKLRQPRISFIQRASNFFLPFLEGLTKWKNKAEAIVAKLLAAGLHSSAYKIDVCSSQLSLYQCENGHQKIEVFFRCKQRFCPRCSYLHSAQVNRETVSAVESLQRQYKGLCLFLVTFTVLSQTVEKVGATLDRLNKAFPKMLRRREIADPLLGTFRGIHIEFDASKELVNVHIHALFAFKSSIHNRHYIKNTRWLELWRESFQEYSITQVHVERVMPDERHPTITKAAGAVAGYAAYSIDLSLSSDLYKMSSQFLRTLHFALKNRKLYCFTGALGDARPEKPTVHQPEHTCPDCSSPLTESLHQWDQQTKTYAERKIVVVSEFHAVAAGKKVEADPIEVGDQIKVWPNLNESGTNRESQFSAFLPALLKVIYAKYDDKMPTT